MESITNFSFNSNNTHADWNSTLSLLLAANPRQVNNNHEEMFKALMAMQPMVEDSKPQIQMMNNTYPGFGGSITPPTMSRCVSLENNIGKNYVQWPQPQGLQLATSAPMTLPLHPTQTQMTGFNFAPVTASSLPAFSAFSIPNAPSLMNRGCTLEFPLSSRTTTNVTNSTDFSSPSPSTDSSTVNSPNPALCSSVSSVADSEYDDEQYKAVLQRQMLAARQHNLAVASSFQERMTVSPGSACSSVTPGTSSASSACATPLDSAPQLEVQSRRGRRRRGDGANAEAQERRRRRRLESHMRYDRHRRDVLQKIFTDLRSLIFTANTVAENSNQTLTEKSSDNSRNVSSSSVSLDNASIIFLRSFSREDLEKLSVCDLLSVTHRCLRSLNQLKGKLEKKIEQLDGDCDNQQIKLEQTNATGAANQSNENCFEIADNVSLEQQQQLQMLAPVLDSLFPDWSNE